MSASELQSLEENIQDLKEQLAGKRKAWIRAEQSQKARLKQSMKDTQDDIEELEQEKREVMAAIAQDFPVDDQEAETIIAEIMEQDGKTLRNPPAELSSEIIALLQEILVKLDQLDVNASAKLMGIISTYPPFMGLSYVAELDTETTLRKYVPTFYRWGQELRDRLKK